MNCAFVDLNGMSDPVKRSENTIMILAITPIIVAAFVLGGLFIGFYVADLLGIPKFILALVLSTGGLFASLPVVVKFVGWMMRKEAKKRSSDARN
jgi:hypothetical protein